MKFESVLKKVKDISATADISSVNDLLAIQVTLTGKDGGVFYVEVKDSIVSVEPYEYNDRQANIIISNDNFCKLMAGKLDPVVGFTLGKIKVEGDLTCALTLSKLVKANEQNIEEAKAETPKTKTASKTKGDAAASKAKTASKAKGDAAAPKAKTTAKAEAKAKDKPATKKTAKK